MDARRSDEGGDRAGLVRLDFPDGREQVERLVAEPEVAAADRRDERDLVAVAQLPLGPGVLAVDGVEQAVRLAAQLELRPDVADVHDAVDLALRPAGLLAKPGEEADADAHALMLRAARETTSTRAAAPEAAADPARARSPG